jgi:PAS domain S-box-containing protein
MNLRTKLLLGIGIALIVTFAIVAIFSVLSMEKSYQALEEQEVITTVERAQSSLAIDKKNLRSVTRDYAAWTETLRFAGGENPDWIETNTGNDFFERFGIQGILVFDTTGNLIFSKGYDATLHDSEPVPDSLAREIVDGIDLDAIEESSDGTYTILETGAGPLIVSSHPVLTDLFEGPAGGSLHYIRWIDDRYLAELSTRAGNTITIIPAPQHDANPALYGSIAQISPEHPVVVVPESPDMVRGFAAIKDLREAGRYYLMVSEPRTIYQSGQATIIAFIVSLLGAGIFIVVFVLLFIDRIVLSRINRIINTVRAKTVTSDTSENPEYSGNDELGMLASEIDPVFERLAESRAQLQQSEERYRTLAESAQDFIYIIDTRDRVTYVNSFAAAAVKKTQEEIIGKPRSALFPEPESNRQYENIRTVIATGQPLKIESNLPLPTGEQWNDTLLVPLRDRNTVITGVLGITRDITQRKQMEEALFQVNKKLNLLSSVTRHDILNQLTALRTYLELSLDYTNDPAMTDFIAKEKQIAEIIDQQISFTRDYQKMGLNAPTWQDISATISWVIQPLADPSVKISIDTPQLEIFADPMLEKVFYNLVDNAIRHGGKALSEIRIFTREDAKGLLITVEDNGAGIADENKEQIFERGVGQNTGFGLFLSREILGITGITIRETGTYGSGARMESRVPRGTFRHGGIGKRE